MLIRKVAGVGLAVVCSSAPVTTSSATERTSRHTAPRATTCACPSDDWLWTHLKASSALYFRAEPAQTGQISVDPTVGLPSGRSTATSFWDGQTASGREMSALTLASPYWPIGTRVKITYHGRSAVGTVWDFGPAEWAVAQHDPPAIVDLAEPMMKKLTGSRQNSVAVHFQVLRLGSGRVYRHSGTGHALATR